VSAILDAPTSTRRATDDAGATAVAAAPGWTRLGLAALLAGTALLYCWTLSASGYANEYYAAAVQAGTQSWKALLFGSLDAAGAITVDKPPASLWLMGLSGRLLGFSSWSMLLPQALAGVGSVWLLYASVRRTVGAVPALAAGAILALTPVAALMFRFNNPDALLTLLLVAAAYCVLRAIERGGTGWLVLAGTAVGFAFLAKMLQAFLVLPAFGLSYLIAAPVPVLARLRGLVVAAVAVVLSSGWYVALVALWPAADRPYIGGSTNNSLWELAFGYNGLSRLTGSSGPAGGAPGGGGAGGTGFGGSTGAGRMLGDAFGTQIAWLLPAALVGLLAGLWLLRRAPRTDRTRAALIVWGGWLLVSAAVFSTMSGVIHPYYAVVLAPAIAALVAIAGAQLWAGRNDVRVRALLALTVAGTAAWADLLLGRDASWHPELRPAVTIAAVVAVAFLLAPPAWVRRGALRVVLFAAVAVALVGGPAAYTLQTVATAHGGSIPMAGPTSATLDGDRGGPPTGATGQPPPGAPPMGAALPQGVPGGPPPGMGVGGPGAGNGPGPGSANAALAKLLRSDTTSTWAAATVSAQAAAPLELATGRSVIAIGGFSGSDDAPTLARFKTLVSAGAVHWFVGGGGGPGGQTGSATAIATWVAATFTATTVGGQTVYDLTTSP
jgi:4-amino-4-deoxy-L-arabinose transferase-like glycosyltransferase